MQNTKITKETLNESYEILDGKADFGFDYIALTLFSAAICSFGFRMNSTSIIVGSMVISPLLFQVVGLGASLYLKKRDILSKNIYALLLGIVISVIVSIIINKIFPSANGSEILSRIATNSWDYFFVAFFSGLAGTLAFFWPGIIEAIVGIGIAVALMPPVVMIGIGYAEGDAALLLSSFWIVLLNILGILAGSYFAVLGLNKYFSDR